MVRAAWGGGGEDYVHYLGAHWPLWPPTATVDQCVDLTGTSGIATCLGELT